MLKKYIASFFASCIFSISAYATTPTTESIEQLIEITQSKQQYEQSLKYSEQSYNDMMQQIIDSQKILLSEKNKLKFKSLQTDMLALIMKESQWEKIQPDMIQIAQNVYTQEEVNSMIEYYRTPIGQSILKKMPIAAEKNNVLVQQKMSKFMPQFIEKLEKLRTQD